MRRARSGLGGGRVEARAPAGRPPPPRLGPVFDPRAAWRTASRSPGVLGRPDATSAPGCGPRRGRGRARALRTLRRGPCGGRRVGGRRVRPGGSVGPAEILWARVILWSPAVAPAWSSRPGTPAPERRRSSWAWAWGSTGWSPASRATTTPPPPAWATRSTCWSGPTCTASPGCGWPSWGPPWPSAAMPRAPAPPTTRPGRRTRRPTRCSIPGSPSTAPGSARPRAGSSMRSTGRWPPPSRPRELGQRAFEVVAAFDVARLGRPDLVVDRLGALVPLVDGDFAPACRRAALALADRDPAGLTDCSRLFEELGHDLLAAEVATAAYARLRSGRRPGHRGPRRRAVPPAARPVPGCRHPAARPGARTRPAAGDSRGAGGGGPAGAGRPHRGAGGRRRVTSVS